MADKYSAARAFDVGGETVEHFEPGDSVPGDHPHLQALLKDGYVQRGDGAATRKASEGPLDPATNLPVKDAEVYEANEGSVADVAGNEIDVVGHGTQDAEAVEGAPPAERAKTRSTSGSKRTSAKKSSAKSPRT